MQHDLLNPVCILRDIYFGHDIYLNVHTPTFSWKLILVMLKKCEQLIFWS